MAVKQQMNVSTSQSKDLYNTVLMTEFDIIIKGLVHPKIVINYSPSCRSKPIRPSFIFRTQIKIFFDEIRQLSDLHIDCNVITTFKAQKGSKDIVKIVHVTIVVQNDTGEKELLNKVAIFVCFCTQKVFSSLHNIKVEPL